MVLLVIEMMSWHVSIPPSECFDQQSKSSLPSRFLLSSSFQELNALIQDILPVVVTCGFVRRIRLTLPVKLTFPFVWLSEWTGAVHVEIEGLEGACGPHVHECITESYLCARCDHLTSPLLVTWITILYI